MKIARTTLQGLALAIFVGTVWLYWPSVAGGFLSRMDDDEYLRQSIRLRGLSWPAVRWAFTNTEPYYHPLPRLSHVLDYQFWGTNPEGHHLTSVLLHALNAALVFGFLWTFLRAAATSWTTRERLALAAGVAVVFAIHPLQVESVAWMSGRTQLLCAAFGIGCLWAHVAGARRWIVWALFIGALLSKPMAVSLPFVMLALDYALARRNDKVDWGKLLRQDATLMLVSAVWAAATIVTESRAGGLLVPLEKVPLAQRVLLMAQGLMFYPSKLIWPARLSPYYPRPLNLSLFQPLVLMSVFGVVAITTLCLLCALSSDCSRESHSRPEDAAKKFRGYRATWLVAGWGTYLFFILPVSGLTQTGDQAVADRYAYLAMLPLLLLAGAGLLRLWRATLCPSRPGLSTTADATERVPPCGKYAMIGRCSIIALLIVELFFFALRTRAEILIWHDDETLWRAALAQFPDSDLANEMLAQALLNQQRVSEALGYARHAVQAAPSAETHRNVGIILAKVGETDEAIREFESALKLKPNMADTHCNLAVALQRQGKIEEAIGHYQQALRANPNYADAHYDLGTALARVDRTAEAIHEWEAALRINPYHAMAEANIGVALEQGGQVEEAVGHYERALRINPDLATVHFDLGNALVRLGRNLEAIQHYQEALRINPDYTAARKMLARLRTAQ